MFTTGKILLIGDQRYPFSALWGFSFWIRTFSWTFSWDVKTLSLNFLLKSEGILRVLRNFCCVISMFFIFDHSWKVCQSFINICYLHDFFFIFVSCHIGPGWSNGWSNGVRRSFLIRILFLLNISWRTASIKNLFWLRYFLCSLSLLCIDLRIAVVIHVF